jgi:hypothetical protein
MMPGLLNGIAKSNCSRRDLQSSSNSMTDVIGWSLASVFYLNLD